MNGEYYKYIWEEKRKDELMEKMDFILQEKGKQSFFFFFDRMNNSLES